MTMIDGEMMRLWLVLLCVSSCRPAPVSDDLVVMMGSVGSVSLGQTAVLPCWLSQGQSAEALEVRWYRGQDHFDTPIIHYQAMKYVDGKQEASYVGRVSFGLKDSTSGGLKTGDVSLKLVNITTEDAGEYTCDVSGNRTYDSGTVSLPVTEMGTSPLLSVTWTEDNMMNLSCQSEGWFPQPVLRWSTLQEDLTPTSLVYSHGSSGLHSVHSWLFAHSTSEISCSVSLSKKEAKESRMHLNPPARHEQIESKSTPTGWVAFGVILIATLILLTVLGALYMGEKGRKSKPRSSDTEESESLVKRESESLIKREPQPPASLSQACTNYTNITLEKTTNQFLRVIGTMVQDAVNVEFPDGSRVSCLTAIRGTPGFSAGRHYWEVSLGHDNIGIKESWWVGVTTATEIPHDQQFSPNTSNGFWYLSSSPSPPSPSPKGLMFSTEPKVFLPINVRPQTLGVYLDYDSGEISFYNVEDKSLIGSFTATFTGEVFPLFNPGKGDIAPMTLVHKDGQSQSESTQENLKT